MILANNNEQTKANQRIMDAAQTLENASPYITEWDESAVRQLVETVKILSKDEVAVTLKGGIEIQQKIVYSNRSKQRKTRQRYRAFLCFER